jgi:hypothetical protein
VVISYKTSAVIHFMSSLLDTKYGMTMEFKMGMEMGREFEIEK